MQLSKVLPATNTRSNCARIKNKGTSATGSPKSVTRAKGVPRSATALPCIGPEKLRPSSPSVTERIRTEYEKDHTCWCNLDLGDCCILRVFECAFCFRQA